MRKRYNRTLITFLLCGVTVIAGCSSGGNKAASEAYELENITFPLEEEVSLKIMTSSSALAPEDPNEKLLVQRLEEQTGVHIEWANYTGETFGEKRNLSVASGELPDAIMNAGYSDFELLSLGQDGVILPLEDLIEQHMPNLQAVLDKAPEYREMMTAPDGHIYAFPWIEELGSGKESIHSVAGLPWINVEWLDNVGLDMPTTTEELEEALLAFKTKDPNGNGEADEIPMSFIINNGAEDPGFLFGSFGLGDNGDHTVVSNEGDVVFTAAQAGYKEGIKYLNGLYEQQLIDIEAFEQDWNTYVAKGREGRYGMYFTWDKASTTGMNDTYKLMPPLEGPDGHKNVTRANGMGFDRGRMVITTANQNLELTAKWIDQLYDPHMSVQANWGTYGSDTVQNIFEFDEGEQMLKHLPLEGTPPGELRGKTSIGGPLAILDEYYGTVTTKPDDAAWRLDLLKEVMVPHMSAENIYPRLFQSVDVLERLSEIEADLIPYVERKKAEWITNGTVEEEWEDYLAELDRLGFQEWLEIKQAAYDEFMEAQQ
ncbi:ABC transporter substrate-binding protein [Aureibacillus halotolerans]|uniref:Putative aldouronate transport system substrate-binding protein n=1 Tax=Aureibacillus halotolerans TaxID=1508390 RepID=A0A4R6U040_9BACI|nr:ABC transporter substrate-binding protein [Aureibacillus halotolerans]TDQ37699.1 putative aldouronate transport system substrate-binding protein [Aureibacillus halotolerans]